MPWRVPTVPDDPKSSDAVDPATSIDSSGPGLDVYAWLRRLNLYAPDIVQPSISASQDTIPGYSAPGQGTPAEGPNSPTAPLQGAEVRSMGYNPYRNGGDMPILPPEAAEAKYEELKTKVWANEHISIGRSRVATDRGNQSHSAFSTREKGSTKAFDKVADGAHQHAGGRITSGFSNVTRQVHSFPTAISTARMASEEFHQLSRDDPTFQTISKNTDTITHAVTDDDQGHSKASVTAQDWLREHHKLAIEKFNARNSTGLITAVLQNNPSLHFGEYADTAIGGLSTVDIKALSSGAEWLKRYTEKKGTTHEMSRVISDLKIKEVEVGKKVMGTYVNKQGNVSTNSDSAGKSFTGITHEGKSKILPGKMWHKNYVRQAQELKDQTSAPAKRTIALKENAQINHPAQPILPPVVPTKETSYVAEDHQMKSDTKETRPSPWWTTSTKVESFINPPAPLLPVTNNEYLFVMQTSVRKKIEVFGVYTSLKVANRASVEFIEKYGEINIQSWPQGYSICSTKTENFAAYSKVVAKEFEGQRKLSAVGKGKVYVAIDISNKTGIFVVSVHELSAGAWGACRQYWRKLSIGSEITDRIQWTDDDNLWHAKGTINGVEHHWYVEGVALDGGNGGW